MLQVASALGGVHAQVMSSAELALWLRSREKGVQASLWHERSLVKTWAMRGTLHLLPAAEWALWSVALATRESWRRPAWLRNFETTESEMEALIDAVAGALDTEPRTKEELAAVVGPAHRERVLSGWGSFLKPVAFRGLLCFGPNRGRNVTFVHPDAWLGPTERLDQDEALREVARRYVRTYGPASPEHFADWWGVRGAAIRHVFQSLELDEVAVDGITAWAIPGQAEEIARQEPARGTLLLGGFDPLVVGWRPRDGFVPDGFLPRVSRTAGWISRSCSSTVASPASGSRRSEASASRSPSIPSGGSTAAASRPPRAGSATSSRRPSKSSSRS
jgi:hypothetical protein